ncbi:MAG: DUF2817 domain-containing protein [Bradymonadales bacterium]|nr:DUF2817 domain-containing protein [Bradymonadales bacterium]
MLRPRPGRLVVVLSWLCFTLAAASAIHPVAMAIPKGEGTAPAFPPRFGSLACPFVAEATEAAVPDSPLADTLFPPAVMGAPKEEGNAPARSPSAEALPLPFPVTAEEGVSRGRLLAQVTPRQQDVGQPDPRCSWPATSYEAMRWTLETLARHAPEIARLEILGTSVQGRPILGLRISDHIDRNEMEPEARVVGAIHGNERISYEVAIFLAIRLVKGYTLYPEVNQVVDGVETLIIPMLNPDGVAACTRENALGVDLNRNFSFMQLSTLSGNPSFSEPESRALRDDALDHPYVLGLSYHATANYLNLVWNYTPVPPRHLPELFQLMRQYSLATGYVITLGWHWYAVYGEMTDWSYGTRGMLDTIVEIPGDPDQGQHTSIHVPRALTLLSRATEGLAGRVRAADTGAPLSAWISVEQRPMPIYTEPENGDFHTFLLPGSYSLIAHAPGYQPLRIDGIQVPEDGSSWTELELEPGGPTCGFAVLGTLLPGEIDTGWYQNRSQPADALGPPDGEAYALEPTGEIALDLGTTISDREGPDLRIHEATVGGAHACLVLGAADRDGPFFQLGKVQGTAEIDLAEAGVSQIRYLRLVDLSTGSFGDPPASFGLDAVEVLEDRD